MLQPAEDSAGRVGFEDEPAALLVPPKPALVPIA
jgi:hypothetical protein